MKIQFPAFSLLTVTTFATTALVTVAVSALPASGKSLLKVPHVIGHHKATNEGTNNGGRCTPTQWITGTVLINASPDEVWKTIHEERLKDPDLDYSKVVEQTSPTECKLEQKFNFIPIIGSSVCLMKNTEVPNQRIDYALLHSDRFKAMEGSWILTSCEEGKTTKLELSSHLDLGLPVPRSFMNSITSKKINKRLNNIKIMAEAAHSTQVASTHKVAD